MAEDLLSSARSALDASDYHEALSQTEEALEVLGRELEFELEEERRAVAQLMEAGKALEADVSKAQSYLSKSEKDLEKSEYEKAFNSLKQARAEAERQLKKAIESGEASLKAPIQEAKKLGADIAAAESLAKEAMKAAKDGDYGAASQLIRKALQELVDAKFQSVLHTISLSRPKFLKAREMGADVKGPVGIFNKAREALQSGNFKDALYYAEKGNEELDNQIQEFSSAHQKMAELTEEIRSFSEQGLNLSEAESLLKAAEEELSGADLKSWSSLTQRIEKSLESARSERASELLEESQFLLTLAEKTGLSLSEESEGLHECSQALKAGEAGRALRDADQLKSRLEEGISSHLRSKLENVKEILPEEELGDTSELILKAETALEVRDYQTAAKMVGEAHSKAEGRAGELASTVLEGLAAAQQLSANHSIDAYGLREAHLSAKRSFDDNDPTQVFNELKRVEEQLRGLSQEAFEKVKARVIEVRNSGIGIEGLKGTLKKAKAAIVAGDIIPGLIHLQECDTEAKDSLDLYQKVHDTMASAAVLIAEGKKKQVNMSRAIELLLKGKTAFEAGDLKRALEYAQDSRAEAEKEISVLNVTDRIMEAKESLELARMLEVDVSVWSNLMRRAKQSLDAKDFREAVELAMEVEEQANAGIRNKINSKVARAEALLDKIQVPAKEIGDQQASISKAKEFLEDGNMREAAEIAKKSLAECDELVKIYEGTLEVMRRTETFVSDLQSMSVKVSGPEKLISKASKVLEDGNLKHARQLGEEALAQLEKLREESVERTMKSFEAVVAKAKSDGINTSTAEKFLQRARSLLKDGSFQEALAAAMQSEAEVEKMGLQKEIAENALETARKRIMGLPSPVTYLTKLLEESEVAFEKGDYVASLEASIQAGDEFTRLRETWEDMENSEEIALGYYRTAEKVGVDVSRLAVMLEDAKEATERGDLDAAKEAFDELGTQAAGLTSSYLTQLHTQVRNAQVMCSLLNCEVEDVEERLSEGRSYTDENKFEKAYEILYQTQEEVVGALRQRVEELIAKAEEALGHAEKLGVNTKKARQMVEEARTALSEGRFEKAVRLSQESTDILKSKEDFNKRFMEATYEAESLIKTAKKFGIDVKKAEKYLQHAFDLKDTDPDGALREARESLRIVQSALEAFSPSLDLGLDLEVASRGTWNDATLILRNRGRALAKDVSLEVLGDLEVQDLQVPNAIRANSETEIELRLMFNATGTIPVMIKARAKRVLDDQEYEWEKVFNISVDGAASQTESRSIVADFDTRCSICRGVIKKGFPAKKCVCSALLHEPCAMRSGKCPICQRGV